VDREGAMHSQAYEFAAKQPVVVSFDYRKYEFGLAIANNFPLYNSKRGQVNIEPRWGNKNLSDLSEMEAVTVTCSGCLHEITFHASHEDTGLLDQCPFCHRDMKGVGNLLGQYRKFYNSVLNLPHTFEFRVNAKS
jgi:hypothetical protein